jgi:transposase-like protein
VSKTNSKPGAETRWPREFKLRAVARMNEAANITALAKEFGVARKLLYIWRDKFQSGGAGALHPIGRPLNVVRFFEEAFAPPSPAFAGTEQRRIEELERKACPWACFGDRPAAAGTGFFSRGLAAGQGTTPEEGRTWRDNVFAVIRAEIVRQGDHMRILT